MIRDLAEALGDRVLLRFVSRGGRLGAVSVTSGGRRLHDLGDARTTAAHALLHELRDARTTTFRARLHDLGDARTTAARARLLDLAPSGLDHLLAPAGDRPLVVVPSPEVDRVPWAALPSCRGREVSVAPSARAWLAAVRTTLRTRRRLWASGPGLRHARAEVTALRRAHGGDHTTTVADTLARLARADVVHIAAHGVRRPDHPARSHLRLADGPLRAHHFDHPAGPPSVVVLSACDSGLAPSLLARGVRTVVASLRDVPDDRVVPLMLDLHAGLGRPARALAAAQLRHGHLGFVCYGAG